ncbi:retrovirus-related pol polyprotein from transposon TNT 1-94 [Tanacetum coccineum]
MFPTHGTGTRQFISPVHKVKNVSQTAGQKQRQMTELLYSPMFSELLNGTSPVVSKSFVVHPADNPDKRQQHNTTHTSTITYVADPPPLNIQSTHQTPTKINVSNKHQERDHAGCLDSRKSTSGGIQFLGGDKLVSWSSKKHDCTSRSLQSRVCCPLIWRATTSFMVENSAPQIMASTLLKYLCIVTPNAAISPSRFNPVQHTRTKHKIDVRDHSNRNRFEKWRERFMNYLEEQTDGEVMINSIQNGDHPLPVVAQVSLAGTAPNAPPTLKDPQFWTAEEKKNRKIDRLARSLLIQGLQTDICSLMEAHDTAKAFMGMALKGKMHVIKDLKSVVRENNCELSYNKFLNNLQPEEGNSKWSKRKEKVAVNQSRRHEDEDISAFEKRLPRCKQKHLINRSIMLSQTHNNLRTSSSHLSANKKPEYVKSEEKKEDKKVDEKKRDMSKVKCYNCKKEGHFAKDCKKAKVKDYNYYKTKMLLAKKDSDEQVLLAEDQAWMESSSDSDQEINANMVFMAKMENVLSDSEESSSSAEETIAEVSYYTSDFESESEYETSEYYDNSTNYGLFVNNDDDQEIFHDAIESASENFNENHIVSQTDHDQSEVDHNDSEDKDHLVDKLIKRFNHKISKCQKRIEKANQQSKDLENQNKDLQDKYDVLKNQVNTFEEKNNEFNEQIKVLNETNVDLLAQTEVLQEQLKVKHVVIDTHSSRSQCQIQVQGTSSILKSMITTTYSQEKVKKFFTHTECQAQYAKLEEERYQYMIRYSALCDNDKQHRKKIDEQEILFDKMSHQLVEMNNNVLRLQEKILEKEMKISELEECVRNKDLKIEKCLERLNDCENKLHKIGQTRQTIHMIMPSKDKMYNGRKGIGFENPSYFCKAKDLRPSLYDERVIGLGYTPMFLTHSNEALEIEKFKRARENKIEFAYDYGNLNASYVNEKINFSDDYFQEIINPDFEKIDSPFQQTSSLKPYVPTVILEKIIIELEEEVLSLLEKEKENLEIIESLKSKGSESSENAISESENQSENNCHEVEKGCDNLENSNVIAPGILYASCDVNDLFVFDDVSIIKSQVSKMPFRKKPRDSLNVHSRSNSNKSLPRTVFRWLPKMQPLAEPVAKWIPKIVQICLWIIDSGCSNHMTGNRALLMNFVETFLRTVRFGNNNFAVIAGYGDVVIGSMTIKKVYYVEENPRDLLLQVQSVRSDNGFMGVLGYGGFVSVVQLMQLTIALSEFGTPGACFERWRLVIVVIHLSLGGDWWCGLLRVRGAWFMLIWDCSRPNGVIGGLGGIVHSYRMSFLLGHFETNSNDDTQTRLGIGGCVVEMLYMGASFLSVSGGTTGWWRGWEDLVLALRSIEPANVAEALKDADWVSAIFARLKVGD